MSTPPAAQPDPTPPPPRRAPDQSPWTAGPQQANTGPLPGVTPAAPGEGAPSSPWAASADAGRAQSSPWAAQRGPQQERVTSRLRRVVEGLPDWEPLPPGETVVRRPGSTS
ncbi:hypothetical protein [Streptomyces sp. NPDC058964]|uniref:hypothetical protein n=1 Tax=Streptomyces sp. NPDC058964 TaxID=3346681 RepID=UPI0036C978D8